MRHYWGGDFIGQPAAFSGDSGQICRNEALRSRRRLFEPEVGSWCANQAAKTSGCVVFE
ncbi:hypothetical protein PLANPX_4937 [Lacipirellula parvula]|uniref:Uncharacterized protein n=1 Tax=Lacipirellula parvula TaxID=2650471 RepID=A0A5K7XG00_9BACT|nr:hypothetical protein PLANPX_4937 [Lacipirellula parvula]